MSIFAKTRFKRSNKTVYLSIKINLTNSTEKPSDVNEFFGGAECDEGVPDDVGQPESEYG